MIKCFTDQAWDDYIYWCETDKKMMKRINRLLRSIDSTPFEGIGRPEPLKYGLAGMWSRRIDDKHRLVYRYDSDMIIVCSCRYHYDDK